MTSPVSLGSHVHLRHQVEGEAQGEESTLKQFLKDIDQGPSHSKVMKVDHEDRDVQEGESQFEVRR